MSEYIELPMRGLEEPLSEEERAVQDTVHRFAVDVIRPVAAKLDRLTAKEMVDPSSKLWDVLRKSADLGISLIDLEELEPIQRARILSIAIEELSWGCPGLAGSILVNFFPTMYSLLAGNAEMARHCEGRLGCWARRLVRREKLMAGQTVSRVLNRTK
jgi:acyl-CoA dehydrogenase